MATEKREMDNEARDQLALAEEQNVKSMRTSFVHILTFCLPIATLVSCSNQPKQSQSETISTGSTNKSEMNPIYIDYVDHPM